MRAWSAPLWVAVGFSLAVGNQAAAPLALATLSTGPRAVYTGVTPVRIFDTRAAGQGPALTTGQTRNVQITGRAGVPADATAVVLSASARVPTVTGFLILWPAGTARPNVASVNYHASVTITNLVTAAIGSGGQISVYASKGPTDVQLDVVGYYAGHDHDDRYLTKDQAQARVAAGALTCPAGSYLQAVAADGAPTCAAAAPVPVHDSPFLGEGTTSLGVGPNQTAGQSGDFYRENLTLGDGAVFLTNGYRIVLSGTLTLGQNARISNDGGDGTLLAAGQGGAAGSLGGGAAGTCGGPGAQATNSLGGGGSNMGGGTVAARPPMAVGGTGVGSWFPSMAYARSFDGAPLMGGSGGGGGTCGAGATVGGGGGGGGVVVVIAKRIVLTGTAASITADGGSSEKAGGGGGGIVVVASTEARPTGLALSAAGGTSGGNAAWSGAAGLARFYGI
ncbi:MAG TPA: hypothetical protein VF519_02610 [Mycobacteriales bacterium]|jgi:hypothetical protein